MRLCLKYTWHFSIIIFLFLNTYTVLAQTDQEPLFLFRGARPLGLGNAFEAIADDVNALYYNPAGLAQIDQRIVHILLARARVTQDLLNESITIDEFINDTVVPLTDSDDPLTDPRLEAERQRLVDRAEVILQEELGLALGGPSFGIIEPFTIGNYKAALGLSLYTQAVANVRIVEVGLPWRDAVMEMLDNPVFYRVAIQGSLATALSVEVPVNQPFLKTANLGMGLRFIRRGTFTDFDDPFAIEDILDPDTFKRRYFDLDDDEDFADFARKNVDSKTGYSVDFGTLLFPVDGLRVGIAWRNAINNMNVEYDDIFGNEVKESRNFPKNFVMATAVKPLELFGRSSSSLDITLAASWDDPNGDDRLGEFEQDSFTDHIHLGAEVIFWPKELLSLGLRAGDNRGFATYGATLRLLRFLNLNVVRYGNLEADWWVGSVGLSF